jgi:hypothetical protein
VDSGADVDNSGEEGLVSNLLSLGGLAAAATQLSGSLLGPGVGLAAVAVLGGVVGMLVKELQGGEGKEAGAKGGERQREVEQQQKSEAVKEAREAVVETQASREGGREGCLMSCNHHWHTRN